MVGKSLVVLLDVVETIEVVDHDPRGLAYAFGGEIAEPVDPFQPRAVAEMEARHRVDHAALRIARAQEVMRGERLDHGTKLCGDVLTLEPLGIIELLQQLAL